MNKTIKILSLALLSLGAVACEIDNYQAPDATLEGKFIDKVTGKNMELAHGTGNMSIRIMETSYAHGDETVVVQPQSLNVQQDGTFKNTKLFAGTYEMWPFESCCYEGENAKQVVNLTSGKTTNLVFEVTPYFEVEWVDEPWQDEKGYVHATFKFTRNPVPDDSYTPADAEKAQMFISTTMKVGTGGDSRYANNELNVTNADEGNVISAVSKEPMYFTQKMWVRVGVKPKVNATNGVFDKYCLSSIKTIDVTGTK